MGPNASYNLLSSTNNVILCIFWIYVGQIGENQEKKGIFVKSYSNMQKSPKCPVFIILTHLANTNPENA